MILLSEPVDLAAQGAHRRCDGVVEGVFDRRQCVDVGENRVQVVVGHIPIKAPWHDRIQFPRADLTGPYGFDEGGLVVVRDAGRILCDIRGRDFLLFAEPI